MVPCLFSHYWWCLQFVTDRLLLSRFVKHQLLCVYKRGPRAPSVQRFLINSANMISEVHMKVQTPTMSSSASSVKAVQERISCQLHVRQGMFIMQYPCIHLPELMIDIAATSTKHRAMGIEVPKMLYLLLSV